MTNAQKKINRSRGPVLEDFSSEFRTARIEPAPFKNGSQVSVVFEPYAKTQTSRAYSATATTILQRDVIAWVLYGRLPQ